MAEPLQLPVAKPYALPEKTVTFQFEDYPGLEIVAVISPVPLAEYFDFLTFVDLPKNEKTPAKMREYMERFRPFLRSDADLVFSDWQLALALVLNWVQEVAEVPLPLRQTSGNGTTSKVRRASRSRRR
jgi:hypothetical protein